MDRKQMVKTLETHFGVKAHYLGVPSFAYQFEVESKLYTIDKEGRIWTAAGGKVNLEEIMKEPEEIRNNSVEQEVSAEEPEIQEEYVSVEVVLPMEGHSGRTLRNLVNMIYSKQILIKKAFGIEENIVNDDFAIGINEVRAEELEEFQTALEDIGEKSCPGIEFDFYENTVTFKSLKGLDSHEKAKVYIQFVAIVNEKAKVQRYSSAKVKLTENEKYTFRTWLLRLGMIGEEYKLTRKILLQNLSGNGSFKNKKEKDSNEAMKK